MQYKLQNTKELRNAFRVWQGSTDCDLDYVYGTYSSAKARAWKYCEELMQKYNGRRLRVVSHNSMIFTCGFVFDDENGERVFCYITPSYDRFIKVA